MKEKILTIALWFLSGVLVLTLGILIPVVLSSLNISFPKNLSLPKPPKAFVILSGSMEPTVKVGSIAILIPVKNYQQGDIITFSPNQRFSEPAVSLNSGGKDMVTHRIEAKQYPNGVNNEPVYITSGDANKTFDPGELKNENVQGKVILSIPYLGYFANFAKTPKGFILLVIIPATIVIYEELKSLKRQLLKHFKKTIYTLKGLPLKGGRKIFSNRLSDKLRFSTKISKALVMIPIIIPIFGASMVLVAFSDSFFSDQEISVNNTFVAATVFPTPTPVGGVIINEIYQDSNNKAEWVELYNSSNSPVDVSGWKISDENAYGSGQDDTFPSTSLIPSQRYAIVITNQSDADLSSAPLGTILIVLTSANIGSGLNVGGDAVVIKNSSNVIQDSMNYGSTTIIFPSPPSAPSSGKTLSRIPNGVDTNTAADWLETLPSAGQANSI